MQARGRPAPAKVSLLSGAQRWLASKGSAWCCRDMDLRAAAGEAAAVLQACCPEALRLAEEDEGDDDEGEEQADERGAAAHDGWCEPEGGNANGHANGNGMEELVERMQDLATNKGR